MTKLEMELQASLNPEQFQTAMLMDGPAVVMAGAGSGKTHTLVSRVAHLIDSGVNPSQILMLTFTKKAAEEMSNRVSDLLHGSPYAGTGSITACTYHAFCNKVLHAYGSAIGVPEYNILSSIEYRIQVRKMRNEKLIYENLKNITDDKIVDIFSKAANMQKTISDTLRYDDEFGTYQHYDELLEMLKVDVDADMRAYTRVTYDDMLLLTDKLMDVDDVVQKIAQQYRYVMVDEYQDTNNLQESFLLKFGKYNPNIVVVGDMSQSIYGFRGANVRNIQLFPGKLPNCKEVVLYQNYRSSQSILDVANVVMQHNVKSWKYNPMMSAQKVFGKKPAVLRAFDEFQAADMVVDVIRHYHKNGMPYSDMAVLSRGSKQSMSVESKLEAEHIPYEKRGGKKFFERACIIAMLSYLRLVLNNTDDIALYQVLQLHRNIGHERAKKISDIVGHHQMSLSEYAKISTKCVQEQLNMLLNLFDRLSEESNIRQQFIMCADFYREVCLDEIDKSKRSEITKEEDREKLRSDLQLIQKLEAMTLKYKDLRLFLNDVVIDEMEREEEKTDKLVVSTVHGAKGLEWKVVFILDCYDGGFPKRISTMEYGSEKDEEELRCFYVAMTRAKERLFFVQPLNVKGRRGRYESVYLTHYLSRVVDELEFIDAY